MALSANLTEPYSSSISFTENPTVEPFFPRYGYTILSVVMGIVTVTAVVLNVTVIVVTARHRQLRQPLNYALVNLAVADLGTAVMGGVPAVLSNAAGHHVLGRAGCILEGFSVALFGITALCTVALIAVERLFVVCKPLGSIKFQGWHAVVGVVISWLWSLIWNTPPLFGWGSYALEGVKTSCGPDWQSRQPGNVSYILCYFLLCFAVPFTLIVLSYTWLLWTLRQVAQMSGGAAAKAEAKVACMVVAMVLAFLVSWMPYSVLALVVVFDPEVKVGPLVAMLPVYLAKSSTVYNPLIYIFMNKQFQKYAVPFLFCGWSPWELEESDAEPHTTISSVGNQVSPEP
ncbi:parapinopsin-like [Alosa sapidissima]|uniref:parapinopsin-like n=1 Tax=Alosa sapidissima TaxID=34773 RepID=UPI001C082D2A|nr:parapinopsin-like [Alosa sapidissima]